MRAGIGVKSVGARLYWLCMESTPKILVFDSGVGGLSVLKALRQRLPNCDYVYACDNEAFPYGTRDAATLIERVDRVLHALLAQESPAVVVVACNTASTVVLPHIRAHFSTPIVGVVPAIKPAVAASASRVFGLLGTPGTVQRPYTQQLIDEFASDCQIVRVGSSELVQLAEAALRGQPPAPEQLAEILAPFFASPLLDCIVLACTHFPLLQDELAAACPRPVRWIDSGEAIARRVESLLLPTCSSAILSGPSKPARAQQNAIFTVQTADIELLKPALETFGCGRVQFITV